MFVNDRGQMVIIIILIKMLKLVILGFFQWKVQIDDRGPAPVGESSSETGSQILFREISWRDYYTGRLWSPAPD